MSEDSKRRQLVVAEQALLNVKRRQLPRDAFSGIGDMWCLSSDFESLANSPEDEPLRVRVSERLEMVIGELISIRNRFERMYPEPEKESNDE